MDPGRRAARGARARRERAKVWPHAYPDRRDWKQRLNAARTLELTWESEIRAARRPVATRSAGTSLPCPPQAISGLGERSQRWRREGERVILASDQSARLSEILGESGHPRRADQLALARRRRRAASRSSTAASTPALPAARKASCWSPIVSCSAPCGFVGRASSGGSCPRTCSSASQTGELVVHIDHGIARYAGMVRRNAGGDGNEERDFLELHFAEGGRIWVPVEQIERVSRYAGGENPHLSRLGGGEWQRTKSRVRKAVTDLAKELLELYSAREKARRPRRFSADSPWQQEMEAAFPYEETVDQLRATAEVKADLERGRPMDRLVVGDVGYGKTEVAHPGRVQGVSRTARRWPSSCPPPCSRRSTSRRSASASRRIPFTVRMLSRFVDPEQQKDIVEGLAAGIGRPRHRHAPAAVARTSTSATWAWSWSTRSSASASPQGAPQAAAHGGRTC